jgi:double-stranded uracil-DNA glycosylase
MNANGHRIREIWMGSEVETLADLLDPGQRVVCIGINPSPVSVAVGHYYQGTLGKRFWGRLQSAGLLPRELTGFEDDAAFAEGIGFTDIIKRPSPRANELTPAEYQHGEEGIRAKLDQNEPGLIIFTFKKVAVALCGPFHGFGLDPQLRVGGIEAFVMPCPYEANERVSPALEELAARFQAL